MDLEADSFEVHTELERNTGVHFEGGGGYDWLTGTTRVTILR
jgi:hypothetical protein